MVKATDIRVTSPSLAAMAWSSGSRWRRTTAGFVAALLLVGALAACGNDDGGNVRDSGETGSEGGGSGGGSGSGTGSQ